MGMVSRSTVANGASTGSITIPVMKRYGFRPEHAAAIEAVASTGGQFRPPVMGLTAFLIVGITGIPYRTIMLAAVFPALVCYGSLAVAVHLQAHAGRIGTTRDVEIRETKVAAAPAETLARELAHNSHLLVAIGILVYLLTRQLPPAYATRSAQVKTPSVLRFRAARFSDFEQTMRLRPPPASGPASDREHRSPSPNATELG